MRKKELTPITSSLWAPPWFSAMVVVAVFIITVKQVTSQSANTTNSLLTNCCRSYKSQNGELFLSNLNTTLTSIRRQLSGPQVFYGYAQSTDNVEFVYAFALCREYLSTSQCLACFDSAIYESRSCGTSDGANVIYDDCSIRYENFAPNSGNTNVRLDDDVAPTAQCSNESTTQPIATFNKVVQVLLTDIRDAVPRTSNFYVASTRKVSIDNSTVYAIAQCAKNVSQPICRGCLNTAYNNLHGCLPSKDGRAIDFFCFMRYSATPLFQSNQTTNVIPFLNEGSSSKSTLIVGVCSASGLLLFILVLWLVYQKIRRPKIVKDAESGLQSEKSYTYHQFQLATQVFKATIDDDNVVAVKRLHVGYAREKHEFENEVRLISNIQHRNLVQQLGWCIEGPELLLVLEYIPQGSLDKFLWGQKRGTLNWEKRYGIIFGVVRGLSHLHEEFHVKIIHRDIKLNNILVDDDYQPKICDFGLARLLPDDQTHVSTKLAGTLGYMAPVYAIKGHLSEKVDIYSYGIVVLEIISGRRCTDEKFSGPHTSHLIEHAWQLYEKSMHIELIDQEFVLEESQKANVLKTIEIALMCTQSPPSLRLIMSDFVMMLSSGVSLQPGKLIKPFFC